MNIYTNAGASRKTHVTAPAGLSLGGREIWFRTGWSVPLCNAWASLLGIGGEVE